MNGFTTEEDSRTDVPMEVTGRAGSSSQRRICCLLDRGNRCGQLAGNASYNKRIAKTAATRKLQLEPDANEEHIYICDHHKNMILMSRTNAQRARRDTAEHMDEDGVGGRSPDQDDEYPDVDLFQLGMNTLRRYRKTWSIHTRPGLTKPQLADHLTRHFKTLQVTEKEVLTYFIYMAKNYKSKLDQKHVTQSEASGSGSKS